MSVSLEKAKGDPKRDQSVCHCPWCEREVFATVKTSKSGPDGFQVVLALTAVLILVMGYLILAGGAI